MIKKEFLFSRIIKSFPSFIVDDYGYGIITADNCVTIEIDKNGSKKVNRFSMNEKYRKPSLLQGPSEYVINFENELKKLSNIPLYKQYVKELLDPLDRKLWIQCCDELGITDEKIRNSKCIIHDFFFILSGVFVEIDGQHHWCSEFHRQKDEVRDLYMEKKYGRRPVRLKIFGVKFTKFDEKGYGIPESGIVDPNKKKEFDRFKKEMEDNYSDIGYSYLIDQKQYIIKTLRLKYEIVFNILDLIDEKEGLKIYRKENKTITIKLSNYLKEFPNLINKKAQDTVIDMFKRIFEKRLIIDDNVSL